MMTTPNENDAAAAEMETFYNPSVTPPEPETALEPAPEPAPEPVEELPEQENAPEETGEEVEEVPEQETEETKDTKSANRFTKQTRELREAQRQLKALQEQLASLTAEKPKPLTEEKSPDNKEAVEAPKAENYRYGELDPQFVRDTASFEAKTAVERALAAQKAELQTQQQEAARQAEVVKLQQKATEVETLGASQFDDFTDVVVKGAEEGTYPLTQEMFELAVETKAAPAILYHLAKNPDEALEVSEMSPRQQAIWFGRMEVQLAAKAPRKGTQAPVPISSAKGAGVRATVSAATTDFAAFERAAMAKRG